MSKFNETAVDVQGLTATTTLDEIKDGFEQVINILYDDAWDNMQDTMPYNVKYFDYEEIILIANGMEDLRECHESISSAETEEELREALKESKIIDMLDSRFFNNDIMAVDADIFEEFLKDEIEINDGIVQKMLELLFDD